jgi:hypothetical protein
VGVSRAAFRVTKGETQVFERVAESGNTARREFCGACGSPLFASSSGRPDFVSLRAGSLDDPSWFRATADVWVEDAQPWHSLDPATAKFPKSRQRR